MMTQKLKKKHFEGYDDPKIKRYNFEGCDDQKI